MTGTCAVSLFPLATFVRRATLTCRDTVSNPSLHRAWMEKYRARGFSVIGSADAIPRTRDVMTWQGRVGGLAAGALTAACFELLRPGRRAGRRAPWLQWAGAAAVLALLVVLTAYGAARITPAMLWP